MNGAGDDIVMSSIDVKVGNWMTMWRPPNMSPPAGGGMLVACHLLQHGRRKKIKENELCLVSRKRRGAKAVTAARHNYNHGVTETTT